MAKSILDSIPKKDVESVDHFTIATSVRLGEKIRNEARARNMPMGTFIKSVLCLVLFNEDHDKGCGED